MCHIEARFNSMDKLETDHATVKNMKPQTIQIYH